jgi:hypothetical protein
MIDLEPAFTYRLDVEGPLVPTHGALGRVGLERSK